MKNKMSLTSDPLLLMASQNLISMAQAAELTPYSQEYLSLLARKGRLKAVKIGRNWLTTRGGGKRVRKKTRG